MIKAIVFDMDGVLIDAKDWHYEALNRALGLFGFNINRFEHLSTYDGLPTKTKLDRLSIEKGLPRELHSFINEMKQKYTIEQVNQSCKPSFNHEYALSNLRAKGYKIAVASNSIKSTINLMMEKSFLMQYLDCYLSNEDVKKPKPDPEIYIKAFDKLGVTPEECLVVEDNEHGVQAAIASGAHLLQVSDVTDVTLERIAAAINKIEKRDQ